MRTWMCVALALACGEVEAARPIEALVGVSQPLDFEEAGDMARLLGDQAYMVTPVSLTVQDGVLVSLGDRVGERLFPGEEADYGVWWNVTQSTVVVVFTGTDEEVEIEPGMMIFVGVLPIMDGAAPNQYSCGTTCGSGSYACCRYSRNGPPICICIPNADGAQTCAGGGWGATSCSVSQPPKSGGSNPNELPDHEEHTDQ